MSEWRQLLPEVWSGEEVDRLVRVFQATGERHGMRETMMAVAREVLEMRYDATLTDDAACLALARELVPPGWRVVAEAAP